MTLLTLPPRGVYWAQFGFDLFFLYNVKLVRYCEITSMFTVWAEPHYCDSLCLLLTLYFSVSLFVCHWHVPHEDFKSLLLKLMVSTCCWWWGIPSTHSVQGTEFCVTRTCTEFKNLYNITMAQKLQRQLQIYWEQRWNNMIASIYYFFLIQSKEIFGTLNLLIRYQIFTKLILYS